MSYDAKDACPKCGAYTGGGWCAAHKPKEVMVIQARAQPPSLEEYFAHRLRTFKKPPQTLFSKAPIPKKRGV